VPPDQLYATAGADGSALPLNHCRNTADIDHQCSGTQALAEKKAWTLQERSLPLIATNPIHLPFRGAPLLMVRGSWAESVANNAEIAQSVVWLPVHMGNVG